ncbi:MAG: L,D-transpeptidase family protein [Gemmatimonadaceae bacterium]
MSATAAVNSLLPALLLAAAVSIHRPGPPPSAASPVTPHHRAAAPSDGRPPAGADSLQLAMARRLGGAAPAGIRADQWERMRRLYRAFDDKPLWLTTDGRRDRATALLQAIARATDDGLDVSSYPLEALLQQQAALRHDGRPSAEQRAGADVLLTGAYVSLAADLLVGQLDPAALGQRWNISTREPDLDDLLLRVLREPSLGAGLEQLRPTDGEYDALRRELARYRTLVDAGGWPRVPAGATLSPADTAPAERLAAIVGRLRAEGYVDSSARAIPLASREPGARDGRALYDSALAGAVARFQARHGIVVDSILGPETLAALNVPADYRLGQIAANLERHRWLARTPPERYVAVNVPAFRLQAFEDGREVLLMRVIVGASYDNRDTPTFEAVARDVIFRPYWNVPDRIAGNELWPRQRRDPSYFARNRYELVWQDGRRRIRQLPGPENALGLMKLDLPNRFDIYLHDTPTTELFRRDIRAFSHGCIRVEKPAALAGWALGWDDERVREAMYEGADDQRVDLDRPLPVRVVYLTAFTSCDGLCFGNDIYGRDAALVRAVAGGAMPDRAAIRMADELAALLRPRPSGY